MKSIKTAIFILLATVSTSSQALMISETVDSMDNLYFTPWGHSFADALGTGVAAGSVMSEGSAFNFSGAVSINISASGEVVDNGIATTDANGIPNDFMDGNFRDLAVYSLIGLWSTTPNDITPIGDPATAPFFVGTNLLLSLIDIPDVPQLYLFLAENDGIFRDNEGSYNVNLDVQFVPLPASGLLLLSGLLGIFATKLGGSRKSS